MTRRERALRETPRTTQCGCLVGSPERRMDSCLSAGSGRAPSVPWSRTALSRRNASARPNDVQPPSQELCQTQGMGMSAGKERISPKKDRLLGVLMFGDAAPPAEPTSQPPRTLAARLRTAQGAGKNARCVTRCRLRRSAHRIPSAPARKDWQSRQLPGA